MSFLNVLKSETCHILKNKKIWIMLVIICILNITTIVLTDASSGANPDEYKSLKGQIIGLDYESQLQEIEETAFSDEESEDTAISVIISELEAIYDYSEYLNDVLNDAKENQNISIFKNNTFSNNNLKKTAEDYSKLKSVSPRFVGGFGLAKSLSYPQSDVCILLLIIMLIICVILDEKKSGVFELYKSTPYGRGSLCIAKICIIVIGTGFINMLIFFENTSYAIYAYGSVDLTAAVQSLYGYNQCALNISIGEFLILAFLVKWLAFVFIALVMLVLAALMKNEIFFYAFVSAFFLVEFLIYRIGFYYGTFSFLKYFNIYIFLDSKKMFMYYNYNFFDMPVHLLRANLLGLACLCILLTILGVVAFVNHACNYKAIAIKRLSGNKKFCCSVFGTEGYKILYGNKVFLFLLILILFQIASYYDKSAKWYESEIIYKTYMTKIEGEVTEEKLEYIDSEEKRFEELRTEYEEYNGKLERNEISEQEFYELTDDIQQELDSEYIFQIVKEYVDYICELDDENKGFVYDRGWRHLAGSKTFENDIANGILLVLCLILSLSNISAQEYHYRMNTLINTGSRRNKSLVSKTVISFILITFIFMLVYLPEIIWVINEYGCACGSYTAASLKLLRDLPVKCSITQYFIIIYFLRYLAALIVGFTTLLLGRAFKNSNLALVTAALLFLFPLILHMLGINVLDVISLNRLISGNMLFLSNT